MVATVRALGEHDVVRLVQDFAQQTVARLQLFQLPRDFAQGAYKFTRVRLSSLHSEPFQQRSHAVASEFDALGEIVLVHDVSIGVSFPLRGLNASVLYSKAYDTRTR